MAKMEKSAVRKPWSKAFVYPVITEAYGSETDRLQAVILMHGVQPGSTWINNWKAERWLSLASIPFADPKDAQIKLQRLRSKLVAQGRIVRFENEQGNYGYHVPWAPVEVGRAKMAELNIAEEERATLQKKPVKKLWLIQEDWEHASTALAVLPLWKGSWTKTLLVDLAYLEDVDVREFWEAFRRMGSNNVTLGDVPPHIAANVFLDLSATRLDHYQQYSKVVAGAMDFMKLLNSKDAEMQRECTAAKHKWTELCTSGTVQAIKEEYNVYWKA